MATPLELAKCLRNGKYLSWCGEMLYFENKRFVVSYWEGVPDYPRIEKRFETWKQVLKELRSGKWW